MKTTFKTKLLLHLNQKKEKNGEKGFTLIELLVVIIIIGILAAIALPSFLNQANKGKQAEGKQYSSSINKAQQAYYTENGNFVSGTPDVAFASLGVGIRTQTANYTYSVSGTPSGSTAIIHALATPISGALKGYAGTVALIASTAGADSTSQAIVCETNVAGTTVPTGAAVSNNNLSCASAMTPLK